MFSKKKCKVTSNQSYTAFTPSPSVYNIEDKKLDAIGIVFKATRGPESVPLVKTSVDIKT